MQKHLVDWHQLLELVKAKEVYPAFCLYHNLPQGSVVPREDLQTFFLNIKNHHEVL